MLGTPVSELPGCGPKTLKKLHEHNVSTYRDVLACNNTSLNLCKFKAYILSVCSPELSCHNWCGMYAHILRSKQQVTRVKIENIIILPHRIVINVTWREKGQIRRKPVNPTSLVCIQMFWLSKDIVSDESDSESYDPIQTVLPPFVLDKNHPEVKILSESQKKALVSTFRDVNLLLGWQGRLT